MSKTIECPNCGGDGIVRVEQEKMSDAPMAAQCGHCYGNGIIRVQDTTPSENDE